MKVPKSHFNRFKKEFLRIVEMLGLTHYRIDFTHENMKDVYASISSNYSNKIASVTLTTELRNCPQPSYSPESCGVHEALHLLLADFAGLASYRYITKDELDEEQERIVRRLEKVFMEI